MLDAGVNYNGAGHDYPDYWPHSELSPLPPANPPGFECGGSESFIPQCQDSFITGGPYLGDQYSSWPYGTSFGYFDRAQTAPAFLDEVAVVGHINPLLFPPAGMVGTTQVPVGLPPVDIDNLVTQHSSTSKQPASQDYGREGERTRCNSATREQTQVSPAGIGLTQKEIVTAIGLDHPGCHTLAHASVSAHRATDRVPLTKCAERLETSAFDRFHGP